MRAPYSAGFTIPGGECPGVTISAARSLHLVQGNAGNHVDAWDAQENTLTFEFDLGNGGGTGTTNPAVTAGWH